MQKLKRISSCCQKKPKSRSLLKAKARKKLIKQTLKEATLAQMTRTPIGEEDLIDVPIFVSQKKRYSVELSVRPQDIKSDALRLIFLG